MKIDQTEYKTNPLGLISNPGKFQGEPLYVPNYWNQVLDGDADSVLEFPEGVVYVFYFTEYDWTRWPQLKGYSSIRLIEDGQGFVYHKLYRPGDPVENPARSGE